MKNYTLLVLPLFLMLILSSCSKEIDNETPYAIQLKEVRSYYKALDVQNRLEKNGIESYILSEETNDGNWYRVLSGAEQSITDINKYKKKLENIISIDDIRIINFQKIKENLVLDFEEKLFEGKRLKSSKPNIPEKIYELIHKFPEDKNFIVKRFFIANSPDSIKNTRKFKVAHDRINHDLPRGVTMRNIMKNSECYAEVIYEDNLFGDRVTIDIIRLKDSLDIESLLKGGIKNLEIADYFSELILETGNYKFEDKLKIDISSFQKLSGYKVTIQPKRNKDDLRTYFSLVSKDSKFLVFSQSTDKTDDEIIDIIEELGESDGLESYDEFYNAFYTLPSACAISNEFVSIFSEKLTNSYARKRGYAKWAKKMIGHWQTTASYHGKENNNWSVSFFDLLDYNKVNLIYNNLYIESKKSKRYSDIIDVIDSQGVIDTGKYPGELSFPGNRFVVSINNSDTGRLTSDKMLTIAECLQVK
tara:strand:- start:87 stop:1511 length:1425 start_codon:yes stop_codon:yes gene_type:complete